MGVKNAGVKGSKALQPIILHIISRGKKPKTEQLMTGSNFISVPPYALLIVPAGAKGTKRKPTSIHLFPLPLNSIKSDRVSDFNKS